jgi:hypothetical protein
VVAIQEGAPAEDGVRPETLHAHGVARGAQFHHHTSGDHEVEGGGALAIDENDLVLFKCDLSSQFGKAIHLGVGQTGREGVCSKQLDQRHITHHG